MSRMLLSRGMASAAASGGVVPTIASAHISDEQNGTAITEAEIGATLWAVAGDVDGEPAPTLTYQWNRNDVPISGATNESYTTSAVVDPPIFALFDDDELGGWYAADKAYLYRDAEGDVQVTEPGHPVMRINPKAGNAPPAILEGGDPATYQEDEDGRGYIVRSVGSGRFIITLGAEQARSELYFSAYAEPQFPKTWERLWSQTTLAGDPDHDAQNRVAGLHRINSSTTWTTARNSTGGPEEVFTANTPAIFESAFNPTSMRLAKDGGAFSEETHASWDDLDIGRIGLLGPAHDSPTSDEVSEARFYEGFWRDAVPTEQERADVADWYTREPGIGPANLTAPSISPTSGTAGITIYEVNEGTWDGTETEYLYQWQADETDIPFATRKQFEATDAITSLRCRVTAVNANGATPAFSNTGSASAPPTYTELNESQVNSRLGITADTLLSTWGAGYPDDMHWQPSHAVDGGTGIVGFRLTQPEGGLNGRQFVGAEVQITPTGGAYRLGRYDAWFRLGHRRPGIVQTFFSFNHPARFNEWEEGFARREFDFEFISGTGRMDVTLHMAAHDEELDDGLHEAVGVKCDVPAEAYLGYRKWSIVFNADTVEWFYEDQLMARYTEGVGFDNTVLDFAPTLGDGFTPLAGQTVLLPGNPWNLNPNNLFLQQWASDLHADWLGGAASNHWVPHVELFRVSEVQIHHFNEANVQFQTADWSVAPNEITITALRPLDQGFRPTSIEYQVNGGSWETLTGATGPGTFSATISAGADVAIRAIAASPNDDYTLTGDASATKTA